MLRNVWQKLYKLFVSKKLAIFLFVLIVAISIIGMLIPQDSKVFTSWWFLIVSFVFLINLLTCTSKQFFKALSIWKKRSSDLTDLPQHRIFFSLDISKESIEQAITSSGFRTAYVADSATIFEKGLFGVWASAIIHLGLIIVISGALVSAGFKMTGYMSLMEGEIRLEAGREYDVITEAPLYKFIGHRGYGIGLKKQGRVLDNTGKVDYIISDIILTEDNETLVETSVEVGKPLVYKGLGVYEKNSGFVPLVTITDSVGKEVYKGFLFMETVPDSTEFTYQRRDFAVPSTPYVLNIRLYPDIIINGNKIDTRKFELGNPGIDVTVMQAGQKLSQGVIKQGEKLIFNGNTLSFSEVRHWTGVEIVYDPGAEILFVGCWITGVGMALFFLFNYKKLQIEYNYVSTGLEIEVHFFCLKNRKMFVDEISVLLRQVHIK